MFRMGQEEIDAVSRVMKDMELFRIGSKYKEVDNFEREFAEYMGAKNCLCLSSGTGALISSLVALGIGPGDEVIIPGYTFMATTMAVLASGAIPVLAEVDETLTMDMNDVSNKISKNTKAVIPVHMLGMPCNMDALMALKEKHGFYIIEDCAQADGGSYHGKRLGAYGECGAFSFNYYKIISCGEGGAVITNDDKLFQRAIIYHDVGTTFWGHYEQQEITEPPFSGITMRVSEIQGAIMRVQLKRLDGILKDLRKVKKQIIEGVKNTAIKLNPSNDMAGDCGTILSLFFNTVSAAEKFEQAITAAEVACTRPINTGKHVYSAWTPVLEKRGAYITSMDPYFNPKNKNLNMDVTEKSCPKTLDYLSRTVYLWLHPDWDDAEVNKKIEALKNAAKVIQE